MAALVVLLAGCAVTRWTKPGATRAQYERDNAECEQYAEFYGLLDEDKYLRCMAGKGYRRE